MGRKSKQTGGNLPLTNYERKEKFASSQYGTTLERLGGHSQYQLGHCGLSLTRIKENAASNSTCSVIALCSPSGFIYSKEAILEYLLVKTQDLKEQQNAYEREQEQKREAEARAKREQELKRVAAFEDSQSVVKKARLNQESRIGDDDDKLRDLRKTSYWLAQSQPEAVLTSPMERPPERPASPCSGEPLRRKDLWPIELKWDSEDGKRVVCGVSGKALTTQEVMAYWTDKQYPGTIVLTSVYNSVISPPAKESTEGKEKGMATKAMCPNTNRRIKYTRNLQRSGSSFSSSGQSVQVQIYRPTIT